MCCPQSTISPVVYFMVPRYQRVPHLCCPQSFILPIVHFYGPRIPKSASSVLSTIYHSTCCLFYGPRIPRSASSVLSRFYLLFVLWSQDTKECLVPPVHHQRRGKQGRGEQGRRERGRGVHPGDQLPHLTHRGGTAHRSSPRARR
jgi:hypothetical protein